jgi:DNA polymerase III delta prime subunit
MTKEYWNWTEKYRPKKVNDCILKNNIRELFLGFLKEKNVPNLILSGSSGVGKTSVAIALLEELDCDFIKINASLERGIDVVRNKIMDFASSMSLREGRKYIILDEADGMNDFAQESLRALIEEFSFNAGFIITCNNKDKIISALHSRFSLIDFNIKKDDIRLLGTDFLNTVEYILNTENIKYDKKIVGKYILKYFPDFRKIINELQLYSIQNKEINSGILAIKTTKDYSDLIGFIKSKNWNGMRKYVGENSDLVSDFNEFGRKFYSEIKDFIEENSRPSYILMYNEYDYKMHFVMDKEINVVAFLTEIMSSVTWKL